MFVLNTHTKEEYPLLEKSAINNSSQMPQRESNLMLDNRNQCLQLVPYLKGDLVHKLVCRVPFDQDEIFLLGIRKNKTSILLLY